MSVLPFTLTPAAVSEIERILLDSRNRANCSTMPPVLSYGANCSWTDADGGGGCYPDAYVFFEWRHEIGELARSDGYTELELAGVRVFIHQNILERLHGMQIMLDDVVGIDGGPVLAVVGTSASRRGLR